MSSPSRVEREQGTHVERLGLPVGNPRGDLVGRRWPHVAHRLIVHVAVLQPDGVSDFVREEGSVVEAGYAIAPVVSRSAGMVVCPIVLYLDRLGKKLSWRRFGVAVSHRDGVVVPKVGV